MTQTSETSRNLPALPVVAAKDMIYAQGWKPSAEELAAIKARADFFESEGLSRDVSIKVVDMYTGARLGSLVYSA